MSFFDEFKYFIYHKKESEISTKIYVCGIRVWKKNANIYNFIDKRIDSLSEKIEAKFAKLADVELKNKKDITTAIADIQNNLKKSAEDIQNNLKKNANDNKASIIDEIEKVLSLTAEYSKLLQNEQTAMLDRAKDNRQAILGEIAKVLNMQNNMANSSKDNRQKIIEQIIKTGNTTTEQSKLLQNVMAKATKDNRQAITEEIIKIISATAEQSKKLQDLMLDSAKDNRQAIAEEIIKVLTAADEQNKKLQDLMLDSAKDNRQAIIERNEKAISTQLSNFEKLQINFFGKQEKQIKDFREKYQNQYQELNYADLLHDTIRQSEWLKDKSFSLFGWAANYSFIYTLYRVLDKVNPTNILEMGLGQTTRLTSQYVAYKNPTANLNICEHNQDWIDIYKAELPSGNNIKINHFDLKYFDYDGQKNDKYAGMIDFAQDKKFDLIIVDGPVGGGKKLPRSNILDLIQNNNLAEDFVIIIDDAERDGESNLIAQIEALLNGKQLTYVRFVRNGIKRQCVITSESRSFVKFL